MDLLKKLAFLVVIFLGKNSYIKSNHLRHFLTKTVRIDINQIELIQYKLNLERQSLPEIS